MNIFDNCEQPMNMTKTLILAAVVVLVIVLIYSLSKQTLVINGGAKDRSAYDSRLPEHMQGGISKAGEDRSAYDSRLPEHMQGSMRDTSTWSAGSRVFGVPITDDALRAQRPSDGVVVKVPTLMAGLVPTSWQGTRESTHAGK